jgi:hypothetical protein
VLPLDVTLWLLLVSEIQIGKKPADSQVVILNNRIAILASNGIGVIKVLTLVL